MLIGFSEQYLYVMAGVWVTLAALATIFVAGRWWKAKSRMGRWLARGFLGAWTLLTTFALLETAFALGYDTTDSFGLTKTSKRWYVRHVEYNNWGYRDAKPFRATRQTGKRRIALLGDSFSFGHGIADIADRFGDRLQRKLNAAAPGKWELYNLTEPGADTGTEIELLEKLETRGFRTDIVLLVYCLNDLETLSESSRYTVGTIILDQPPNWLCRESFVANFLYYRSTQLRRPEVSNYFEWLTEAYGGEVWDQQVKRLDELHRWAKKNDATLLVAVFPFLHRLGADYAFADAHRVLDDYWSSRSIDHLDLLPIFQAHSEETLTVNRFDAHPNERAHALAADAIWERLLRPRVEEPAP